MTRKHEELVEKIGQLLEEYKRTCADIHYGQVDLDQCREDLSIDAVAFTLSALRDGLEIPGEQRRMDIANLSLNERHLWLEQAVKSGATQFIALRGTGKEEG